MATERKTDFSRQMTHIAKLLKLTLFCTILFVAFWIRIQSMDTLPEGHFTGIDAYFYYWQAQIVSENGTLPARDMSRWLPLGRDLGQTLNVYAYVIAYTHKNINVLFGNVSLYQVSLYAPPVCFLLGLGALCLFLYHTYGTLFASLVGVLLATLPGAIDRSTAGFSDRDSWCLMLGILAVVTYLLSLQADRPRIRYLWTLASGFTVFVGGLSWEGFGVFLSIILFVEIWRFLTSETEKGLGNYLLWVLTFVPTLYLASPAYRSGYGFAEHLFAFVLVPPVLLLGIRTLRQLLLTKTGKLRPHARTLALGLTLVTVALATAYVLIQRNTFAETTVPLSQNVVMQSIGELTDTDSQYWMILYGYIFVLSIIGFMISVIHRWGNYGTILVISLTLFTLTTFFRESLERLWGAQNNNILFFIAIVVTIITLMIIAWKLDFHPKNELTFVAAISWFLIWTSLSRDAERYSCFSSPAIAFFTAELIQFCSVKLCSMKRGKKLRLQIPQPILKTSTSIAILALLMWLPFPYGYAGNTLPAAKHLRQSVPRQSTVSKTFQWVKAQLPTTVVVAADWIYGSQLNVLGGVKTITDQDTFIQHWIHLYYRYLFCGESEKEALEFLKTHGATHLMLTEFDIVRDSPIYSVIGSHQKQDEPFEIIELLNRIREKENIFLLPTKATPFFNNIQINIHPENKTIIFAIATHTNGAVKDVPYVAVYGKKRSVSNNQDGSKTGGIILYFDEHHNFQKCYYVPPVAWDNFVIRLFLRGIPSDAFHPVYEAQKTGETDVKIWKIHYPPDIQTDVKYLKTGFPEIDKNLLPQ
ncbi:hypothetical protein F4141_09335 [Candidatus Poribacteria bacterium]|nr:hypothetical protein [Candidatus Poribacteria bacterium]